MADTRLDLPVCEVISQGLLRRNCVRAGGGLEKEQHRRRLQTELR
jgi:hypothetical protein